MITNGQNRPYELTRDDRYRPEERFYPFGPILSDGLGPGTANTVIQAPASEVLNISTLIISNSMGSAVQVYFLIAAEGDAYTGSADQAVISGLSIAANDTVKLEEYFMLAPGYRLGVYASASIAIRVSGWVKAFL